MKRILNLKTMTDVRTMTDPYRIKIIMVFNQYKDKALTVKDIAKEIGEPHGKVYYHVKKLLDLSALELVDTKKVNGITAKYYRLAFDEINSEYTYDKGKHLNQDLSANSQMVQAYFNQYRDIFIDFLEKSGQDYPYKVGEERSYLTGENLYFTQETYETFQRDIQALLEKYRPCLEVPEAFEKTFFYAVFSKFRAQENDKRDKEK